jgi:hypothetical protein
VRLELTDLQPHKVIFVPVEDHRDRDGRARCGLHPAGTLRAKICIVSGGEDGTVLLWG